MFESSAKTQTAVRLPPYEGFFFVIVKCKHHHYRYIFTYVCKGNSCALLFLAFGLEEEAHGVFVTPHRSRLNIETSAVTMLC